MEKLPNIHPGEILREDYLIPLGMSVYRLAKGLHMTQTAVSQILSGKRSITALTAMRLERFMGASARFWLNLQSAYDLEEAHRAVEADPKLQADLATIERCEWIETAEGECEIVPPSAREPAVVP
jgi:antitoxin HigA-1